MVQIHVLILYAFICHFEESKTLSKNLPTAPTGCWQMHTKALKNWKAQTNTYHESPAMSWSSVSLWTTEVELLLWHWRPANEEALPLCSKRQTLLWDVFFSLLGLHSTTDDGGMVHQGRGAVWIFVLFMHWNAHALTHMKRKRPFEIEYVSLSSIKQTWHRKISS